jgi:hypothetical protein
MPIGFDKTIIARMALSHVGSKSNIESIDEENPAAKECKLWYEAARIKTLEAFNWSFARRSRALAEHAIAAPTNRWSYRYQFPADMVMPRFIENPAGPTEDAIPFEMEVASDDSKSIVTDAEDAVMLYTFDLETVSEFSVHFVEAMALALGIRIAYKLSGKTSLATRLTKEFDAKINIAPASDVSGSVPRPERDASWHRART